jgi:hypothetical protein
MSVERRKQVINFEDKEYIIQSLFPIDFLSESSWPFHFYQNKSKVEQIEDEIEWKIKPKALLSQEGVIKAALEKGIVEPKLTKEEIKEIIESDFKRGFFIGCLFVLTYSMEKEFTTDGQKLFYRGENRIIDEDKIFEIYLKSKMQGGIEPWTIMHGLDSIPEGYNPRRYDFNNLILITGIQKEAELKKEASRE